MATDTPCASIRTVGYVTDVEGDIDFFNGYIDRSRVLTRDPVDGRLSLRDNCAFVFGGDVCDKGAGDVRVARALVDLKQRYRKRVFLLMGNRDINKMRFTSELSSAEMARGVDAVPSQQIYWVEEANRVLPRDYLARRAQCTHDDDARIRADDTRVNRLRWMLEETMGAPTAFELRRTELAEMRECDASAVGDDAVVESFVESTQAGGFMREYLTHAQIGVVLGKTLFVHGGLSRPDCPDMLGWVPGVHSEPLDNSDREVQGEPARVDGVEAWMAALNGWAAGQLEEWMAQPEWNAARSARKGAELLEYAIGKMRDGVTKKRTVVVNWFSDEEGVPHSVDGRTRDYLLRSGIERVVVGHKPHGDAPVVLKSDADESGRRVEVVMADTSYSNNAIYVESCGARTDSGVDGLVPLDTVRRTEGRNVARGSVCFELLVDLQGGTGVSVHGVLKDGSAYDCSVSADPFIGLRLSGRDNAWTVKLKTSDGRYLVSRSHHYRVFNAYVTDQERESE